MIKTKKPYGDNLLTLYLAFFMLAVASVVAGHSSCQPLTHQVQLRTRLIIVKTKNLLSLSHYCEQGCRSRPFLKFPVPASDKFRLIPLPLPIVIFTVIVVIA